MIKQSSIQEVMNSMRVEEVLADFVNLKRRGSNLISNCPFHDEKTPSFSVSPAKGIYKCFGCQKSGNAVTFLMEHENMSYVESIRWLAQKYNITLEETVQTDEQIQEKQERESLFILNEYAAKEFNNNLLSTEEGKNIGLSYFKERGFSSDIINEFQLGYCLDIQDGFSKKALDSGYKEEYLISLGLSKKYDDKLKDFFRGRVIFPINSLSGKVVGFGARVLGNKDKTAKYLNSPENVIYHKSDILYGMHIAKKHIPKDNFALLVEGYTDVLALHQSGIKNSVASSGTALTTGQLKSIRRFTENLYILYDGDSAGVNAAMKGGDLALENGLNVKVIFLPNEKDPDSYLKENGAENLRQYIQNQAADILIYKAKKITQIDNNNPVLKSQLTKEVINSISLIADPIKKSFYIKECSLLMEIDEGVISKEVNKSTISRRLEKDKYNTNKIEQEKEELNIHLEKESDSEEISNSYPLMVERELCKILIEHGDKEINLNQEDDNPFFEDITVCDFILQNKVKGYNFKSEICNKIYTYIRSEFEKGKVHPTSFFINHTEMDISNFAIKYCTQDKEELYKWDKKIRGLELKKYGSNYAQEVNEVLNNISKLYYEKLSKEVINTCLEAMKEIDKEKSNEKIAEQFAIQNEILEVIKKSYENTYDVFRKKI